jgi:hypothetical protein
MCEGKIMENKPKLLTKAGIAGLVIAAAGAATALVSTHQADRLLANNKANGYVYRDKDFFTGDWSEIYRINGGKKEYLISADRKQLDGLGGITCYGTAACVFGLTVTSISLIRSTSRMQKENRINL